MKIKLHGTNLNEQILRSYQKEDISIMPDLSPHLCENMREYQKQAVEFVFKRYGRVLLADEMGVGKTF